MGALGGNMVIYLFVVSSDELIFSVSGNTGCDNFFTLFDDCGGSSYGEN